MTTLRTDEQIEKQLKDEQIKKQIEEQFKKAYENAKEKGWLPSPAEKQPPITGAYGIRLPPRSDGQPHTLEDINNINKAVTNYLAARKDPNSKLANPENSLDETLRNAGVLYKKDRAPYVTKLEEAQDQEHANRPSEPKPARNQIPLPFTDGGGSY